MIPCMVTLPPIARSIACLLNGTSVSHFMFKEILYTFKEREIRSTLSDTVCVNHKAFEKTPPDRHFHDVGLSIQSPFTIIWSDDDSENDENDTAGNHLYFLTGECTVE